MNEISDKRKYKRIEKQYIARLRIKPDDAQDMDSKDWDMVAVNDLGAGGVYFHVSRKLEIGTNLDLRIGFSVTIPPIECRAIVTRVKKHPNHSVFGIATEFTEIDEHIRVMINRIALSEDPDDQFLYDKE